MKVILRNSSLVFQAVQKDTFSVNMTGYAIFDTGYNVIAGHTYSIKWVSAETTPQSGTKKNVFVKGHLQSMVSLGLGDTGNYTPDDSGELAVYGGSADNNLGVCIWQIADVTE